MSSRSKRRHTVCTAQWAVESSTSRVPADVQAELSGLHPAEMDEENVLMYNAEKIDFIVQDGSYILCERP